MSMSHPHKHKMIATTNTITISLNASFILLILSDGRQYFIPTVASYTTIPNTLVGYDQFAFTSRLPLRLSVSICATKATP